MVLTQSRGKPRDDLELAVDLVNTWDVLHDPPEVLSGVDVLRRLLLWHGHEGAAAAATDDDLVAARELRSRLRLAFEAKTEVQAVAALNRILADSDATPQLVQAHHGWRLRHGPPEDSPAFLRPATALALLEAIRTSGWDRFGLCAGAPCCCVFVDRSRTKSRRFCCHICADRAHQAAYRRRKAERSP